MTNERTQLDDDIDEAISDLIADGTRTFLLATGKADNSIDVRVSPSDSASPAATDINPPWISFIAAIMAETRADTGLSYSEMIQMAATLLEDAEADRGSGR